MAAAFLYAAEAPHAQPRDVAQPSAKVLRVGQVARATLPSGGVHSYSVRAAAGRRLRAEVTPSPLKYAVRVFDPRGVQIADAWVACRPHEPCSVPFAAEADGAYRLEISSPAADLPELAARDSAISYSLQVKGAPNQEAAAENSRIKEAASWIKTHAHPLTSVTAGSPVDDLLPLKDILANARVVGLGEGTHGTREFFQIKHRLLEFLVTEMGFTVLAMELDQGAAEAIDDYVFEGIGDPATVLARTQPIWDTQEVLEMLRWMRRYNSSASTARRIRFVGFDFQLNDRSAAEVIAFLQRVAPDRVERARRAIKPAITRPDSKRPTFIEMYTLSAEQKSSVARDMNELLGYMILNQPNFTSRTSRAEFAKALQSARRLAQFADSHSKPGYEYSEAESGVATRDRYMAENIAQIVDQSPPDSKIVIWAHNEHVRRDRYNMGHYLGQKYGASYYAFGLAFDRGGFRAMELRGKPPYVAKDHNIGPAFQQSVEWLLKRARHGNAFVDFRTAPQRGPAAEWLRDLHPMRSIGFGFPPQNPSGYYRDPVTLGRSYDGIVFIEQTTPARANASSGKPSTHQHPLLEAT